MVYLSAGFESLSTLLTSYHVSLWVYDMILYSLGFETTERCFNLTGNVDMHIRYTRGISVRQ